MNKRDKRIDSHWLKGKIGKQKKDFEAYLRNSQEILEIFKDKIESLEKEVYLQESSENQYDKDWQFLQAHRNGKKEALKSLKTLVQHI